MSAPERTSDDFVARVVDRIEIGRDTADYLLAFIELYERQLARRDGSPLPARLAAIRRALTECTRVTALGASGVCGGQEDVTRVSARAKTLVSLDLAHSEPRRIDTAAAAEILGLQEDSVRYLCRRGLLDAEILGRRHWITAKSVEQYRPRKAAV